MPLRRLAAACGLSHNHLSAVERERKPPPRPGHPFYRRAAELLGVRLSLLERAARRDRTTFVDGVPWHKRPPR